jgi:hypothetical protein
LTPSARSANLVAGDGTKNGLSRSEQKTVSTTQNNRLTGKAPYKFESISLHRGVICEPDFLNQGADRRNLVSASNGGPDDGISSEESRGAIQPIISFGTAPPSRARGPPERQTFSVEAR